MTTFHWDFFGPRGEKTAEHFLLHLRDFLDEHSIAAESGLDSKGQGHSEVYCRPPSGDLVTIQKSLRPQRQT